jgi:hypothetical protein
LDCGDYIDAKEKDLFLWRHEAHLVENRMPQAFGKGLIRDPIQIDTMAKRIGGVAKSYRPACKRRRGLA